MDRYKQARDNRRQKPRPSGRVTRCWYSLVSAMFYCIWNNTAVDDIAEAVSQSRQVSQVAMTTNNNKNDETRHSNTTSNQHLDDRKLETRPSRFGGVSPLPGPRDLYLNTASQSCHRQDDKIREPVANGNARPTPRDLYAKKAQRDVTRAHVNAGEKLETSQCKESLRDVDQAKTLPEDVILNSTEHTKQAAPVNPTISRTSKKQANKNKSPKKPKKGKKAVCKTTPHSSSLGESSVQGSGSLVKESSKKGKTPKTIQASKEDQHRAVFYEPDGRRKGGSVIKDYYEFLIRLLYTGSKTTVDTRVMAQESVTQWSRHTTSKTQSRSGYTEVKTTSLADLNDECQILPDVEEVVQPKTWTLPRYYTEYTDIVPIEVELGLRPPRGGPAQDLDSTKILY
ncbi:hypothetical protein QZH41_005362 [Actinostola sp. cb2023]|nr:hypothetical protein QZH41_005362 [Actinostola sp. cb2023]